VKSALSKKEIIDYLDMFTGMEEYHRFSPLSKLVMTDGVKALCEMCQCYWLVDIIASYQSPRLEKATGGFQVWSLARIGSKATVICDDGNGNKAIRQQIPYTDFPLSAIKLYCYNGVILLPSEY
jgi:hypothetical protein